MVEIAVLKALHDAEARYIVVGGLAVVLHGYARMTADIDLIIDFQPNEVSKVLDVLESLDFRPHTPVSVRDLADSQQRRAWKDDKSMVVLSCWCPHDPLLEVDVFIDHPIPFDELWQRSQLAEVGETIIRIASIADLIALKRLADRPQDRSDIEALQAIEQQRGPS